VQGAQAKLVQGSLWRHVVVMSLTSSVGLMAILVVDLVNVLCISRLLDPVVTAAVGQAGAVLFITTSFGIGVSIAVSARAARAPGQRDPGLARQRASSGMALSVGLGVAFSAVVWLLLGPIVSVRGADLAGDLRALSGIAGPAVMTQAATPVGQGMVTRLMPPCGEAAGAGRAITGRLTPGAPGGIFVLAGAVGPIVGQNAGAGRMDRVRQTAWAAVWFMGAVIAGVPLWVASRVINRATVPA